MHIIGFQHLYVHIPTITIITIKKIGQDLLHKALFESSKDDSANASTTQAKEEEGGGIIHI